LRLEDSQPLRIDPNAQALRGGERLTRLRIRLRERGEAHREDRVAELRVLAHETGVVLFARKLLEAKHAPVGGVQIL
jgi:hypothetical protein